MLIEVIRMSDKRLNYFNGYLYGIGSTRCFDFRKKEDCTSQHVAYMLNRTHTMFRWENLPDTIPERVLELYLQIRGNCCFYEHEGKLYVFTGGLGGQPNVYYMPTIYTIANPALNISKNLKIDEECVVIPNDTMYLGLLPLLTRYATAITETELSILMANINSRVFDLISASDDRTKASAEKFLQDVIDGKLGIIAENAFLDGIRAQTYGTTGTNVLTNLIELEQYFKASWFNEIGLNANYNMKRESINAGESQLNNDALLPLVDDMLRCRQLGAERVNAMFGTDIRVSLASAWEDNQEEIDAEQDALEDGSAPETTDVNEDGGEDDDSSQDS